MSKKDGRVKNGGKRNGSGRKKQADKKETVSLYFYRSVINAYGGKNQFKKFIYDGIESNNKTNEDPTI